MDDIFITLKRVVSDLEQLNSKYFVTGGLVSSFYGEPRLTQDIDFVISLDSKNAITTLINTLSKKFLIDPDVVKEEVARKGIFQAIDEETLIKIDFHVGETIPGCFNRAVVKELLPEVRVKIASLEDAILSKLLWISKGSVKSKQDLLMMIVQNSDYDRTLVEEISEQLDLKNLWREIVKENK